MIVYWRKWATQMAKKKKIIKQVKMDIKERDFQLKKSTKLTTIVE